MSETLYTCDCCVRSGNDEASCHRAEDLCVIRGDVVCDGCRWDEYQYDDFVYEFVPPHEKRIAELEQQLTELRIHASHYRIVNDSHKPIIAESIVALLKENDK